MVKLTGVIFIGFSAAMMGLQLSLKMKSRLLLLKEIRYALEEISAEAEYSLDILPCIVGNTAKKTSSVCSAWLSSLYDKLKNTGEYGFCRAYEESLQVLRQSELKDEDIQIIESLSEKIVNRDQDRLADVFRHTIRELACHQEAVASEYREKSKLYKTLGILFGLFVIIIVI